MKKKRTLVLCALLCLLLTGCGIGRNVLDPPMRAVVTALNDADEQAFRAQLLMPDADAQELHALYADLRTEWEPVDPDAAKLMNFSITTTNGQTNGEGQYVFENGCSLSFAYSDDDYGTGITRIGVSHSEANSRAWSFFSTKTVVLLGCLLLCAACSIVTIVDIAGKRPPKFGWYILMALVSIPFPVRGYVVGIPAGAILWWCIRRVVLKRGAEAEPGAHTYTDTSRDPWEL